MAKHKKKAAYSKAIVILCFITIIAYVVTCFVYLWHDKHINDVLTALFFGCFGIEFASLAFIQRGKLKYLGGNSQVAHVETETGENNE